MKYLFLFIFFLASLSLAQPENAAFRNLTSAEGLPTTSVTDVTQDAFGFIWIGGWNAVYRYDGRSFKRIPSSENGRYLEADKKGGVWISFEKSVGYFDPYSDSIKKYDIPYSERFPATGIDDLNGVWVASDSGVLNFNHSSSSLISDPDQQPSYVFDLTAYKNGELLFVLRKNINGIRQYSIGIRNSAGKYSYEPFPMDFNNPKVGNSFSDSRPFFIRRIDSTGIVIINTFGWAYKSLQDVSWIFKKPLISDFSMAASDARVDIKENIWLNQADQISKINIKSGKIIIYKNDPRNHESILPLNSIYSGNNMFFDRQGILWITRFSQGISLLNLYESDFGLLNDSTGIPIPDILSALELKDGSFWIGARIVNNGLIYYNSDGRILKRYGTRSRNTLPGKSISNELSHPFPWTLAESRDGSIWIGGGSPGPNMGGVSRIRHGTNQITRFKYDPNDKSSISGDWIFRILVDGSDRVWVSSNHGVSYIDPRIEKVTRWLKKTSSDSTNNNSYWLELATASGNIIIGIYESGESYIINHKTLEMKPFGIKTSKEDRIYYIHQDDKGKIWFISDKGFGYLDFSFKKIAYFYNLDKNNFPANEIAALNSDKNGMIWMATDNGIINFDPRTEKFKHFGFERGLQGNYFDKYVNYKGPSGKIYFGGNGGINIFDPKDIKTNPYPPEMALTGLNLDGKSVKFGENSTIKKPIFTADKIIVEPNVLTISIDFSAIHFAGYKDNMYKYKLEGFDKDWIDAGRIGNATYTNLSHGEYTFFIKGSNWDGIWSDGKKSIKLIILPPWWETWWAYSVYFILGISFILSIRKFELNRKLKNAKIRESQLKLEASEAKAKVIQAENERKTKELEEARQLQLSMLPKTIPTISYLDIAVYMKTATEVGGDYYDFNEGIDGTLTAAIGDATGHGMQAGTIVSMIKTLFTSNAHKSDLKTFYNESSNALKTIETGRLMMAFMMIKINSHNLEICNAGMPPLFVYRKQSNQVEEILLKGMPLGAIKNFPYEAIKIELSSGDTILFLSDGLPELKNENNVQYGYERVKESFGLAAEKQPEEIINYLIEEGSNWLNNNEPDDDITFVVIKVK